MLEQEMSLTNCQEANFSEPIFSSLIDVLKKELTIFRELKNAMIAERVILIKPSLHELDQSNSIKENIVLKARMLEEARLNIFKKIARNLDIDESEVKLRRLAEFAQAKQGREIREVMGELASISADINALNETSKNLLDISLTCVKNSLDFISSLTSPEAIYMETGQVKAMQGSGKYLSTEG